MNDAERQPKAFWTRYLISELQDILGSPPPFMRYVDVGLRRYVEVDWDGVLKELWPRPATAAPEGGLLAAQLVLMDPLRFLCVCPLLVARLTDYKAWVTPLPAMLGAAHLNPDEVDAHDLSRFQQYRHQLYRFFAAHPKSIQALRLTFEHYLSEYVVETPGLHAQFTRLDSLKLYDALGLSDAEKASRLQHVSPPHPRTTLAEELAAMLRGERFGCVSEKNFLVVRHEGYADHVLSLGETPPFFAGNLGIYERAEHHERVKVAGDTLRSWLHSNFRITSDATAARFFSNTPRLRSATYTPEEFSVVYRVDVVKRLRTVNDGKALRVAKRQSSAGFLDLRLVPPLEFRKQSDELILKWSKGKVLVDAATLKFANPKSLGGLTPGDFLAYDEHGKLLTTLKKVPSRLFVTRAALATRYGEVAFFAWLGRKIPDYDAWKSLRAQAKNTGKRRTKIFFTLEQDRAIYTIFRPYLHYDEWKKLLAKFPDLSVEQMRERGKFLSFACRRRNLTLEELRDLRLTEQRLGIKAWKKYQKQVHQTLLTEKIG